MLPPQHVLHNNNVKSCADGHNIQKAWDMEEITRPSRRFLGVFIKTLGQTPRVYQKMFHSDS